MGEARKKIKKRRGGRFFGECERRERRRSTQERSLRCNVLKMRRYHKPRGSSTADQRIGVALMGRGEPGPYDCLTVVTLASLNPAAVRHKGLEQRWLRLKPAWSGACKRYRRELGRRILLAMWPGLHFTAVHPSAEEPKTPPEACASAVEAQ